MQKDAVPAVSADVVFASSRFPNYKIGANNQVVDGKDDPKVLSMKEVVARETAQLLEQQKRLSVRDLANKFEKGLAAAAKLSEEAKLREAASLEKHVLLKKLRDALESLRGRVAGRNKDDVEEAIAMVEALAVQLTQREGELIQEKAEVKKLADFLKKASEDAKKLVDEERAFARAEIESARAAVQRVEESLQEHEQMSRASGKQDFEELMKEVQEARRIKMLHQPSKVMDMEHELRALRIQLAEKSKCSLLLRKELAMSKRIEEKLSDSYELDGSEALGSYLRIKPCSNNGPELSKCSIQWYRVPSEGGKRELISGATKSVYAPEPFDVGRILQAEITYNGQQITLTTTGAVDPAPGLGSYVEALVRKHDVEFHVVVTQLNGVDHPSESIHVLHVGKMRIKLCKGKMTIAKEYYSTSMQLCGVRGGGNAAAQALFWQAKKGVSFVLAFESERERNATIMLARRLAFDCNLREIPMAGEDRTLVEILEENNPVDMTKYMTYVSAPQAGAIATFSGTTRDTFDGKIVVELRYESYVSMAIRCIKSICSLARSSWNLHSIAVAHRLGPVPVGETSVFIAVSAVHRADALDACKFLIDELKASVPIWKKEVYSNGEVWKENSEFMERRLDLGKKDGICCGSGREVPVKSHARKTCCGAKVKVDDEGLANINSSK
ncbi:Stomatal closure-related actin-binding protein 1 [Citrus sinensis]|nr:Stomatal closure-related actin-binding protein 1 [Citrus sinensis]